MSGYAEAADSLETLINLEFQSEGFESIHDDIHDSLGADGAVIGIAPLREYPEPGAQIIQNFEIQVKFFTKWNPEIDPMQRVDPRDITEYAERFKRALHYSNYPKTDEMWYYDITNIEYDNDPTGNKTRFIASIRARGNNYNLVETVG